MVRRQIILAACVCCFAAAALGQDPLKVEPSHYHLSFQNEHVAVISVHYGPHEKSALHDHPGGVVVVITKAHLRFTDQNGHSQELYYEPGEARWFPPLRHRVENIGDSPYNAVYIQIKNHPEAAVRESVPLDAGAQKAIAQLLASSQR